MVRLCEMDQSGLSTQTSIHADYYLWSTTCYDNIPANTISSSLRQKSGQESQFSPSFSVNDRVTLSRPSLSRRLTMMYAGRPRLRVYGHLGALSAAIENRHLSAEGIPIMKHIKAPNMR